MKKLLYITANSKPEELSASKSVARTFVNKFMKKYPEFKLEEVDLYKDHIPRLEYQYFQSRNAMINDEALSKLSENEQKEAKRIIALAEQFKSADVYVFAVPMWSLSFPAPVKEYLDCIMQTGVTLDENFKGLLDDKRRTAVYIQSSGAKIPMLISPFLNKGLNYMEDMLKFMGIKRVEKLLVDGTGMTANEQSKAVSDARDRVDDVIDEIRV
ncbi:MAG: NAD(P)H-dependent oxidoreductase [Clostridium sp.]|uniref:FMN-dependent NADH-azoreductase n=1 Tax=Clostridium sp. TaxID=1506 RepID=UPI003040B534